MFSLSSSVFLFLPLVLLPPRPPCTPLRAHTADCLSVPSSCIASPRSSCALLLRAAFAHCLSELTSASQGSPCAPLIRARLVHGDSVRTTCATFRCLSLRDASSHSAIVTVTASSHSPIALLFCAPCAPPRRPTVCTAPRALLLFAHGTPSSLPAFTRARYLLHFSSSFLFDQHLSARATCAMLLHTHWVRVLSALIHVDILQLHPLRVFSPRTPCTPLIL